jgi:Cu/Ag efflux protein CusF
MLRFDKRQLKFLEVLAFAAVASTAAIAIEASRPLLVAQATERASGEGVIKSVNAAERKLLIAHGPIPALKWPGMTMAFSVAPSVDLSSLAPGAKVTFTLGRDVKGLYVIDEIQRVE